MNDRSWLNALGPGLLFAGAAVGVSHIVQSTRAGAVYGLALVGLVIAANLVKYVPFAFGPWYAAATGTSLLEGYRRRGRWALVLYAVLTLGTMFTVQAAVTLVTGALAVVTLGLPISPATASAWLIAFCGGLLLVGRFALLDRLIKVVVGLLTVATFAATALIMTKLDWASFRIIPAREVFVGPSFFFVAALVGWMPSAIDVSVWHSLWALAKQRQTGHRPSMRNAMLDFNIGYIGTAILALCFIVLGAGTMHNSGETFAPGAAGFVSQVIGLYTNALGEWSAPLIGGCALAVMFSTTLTVLDGFPRAIDTLLSRFGSEESPTSGAIESDTLTMGYWGALVVLGGGALLVIVWLQGSLKSLVDLATTLSFLTAPLLSWLNHRAVTGAEVPLDRRPPPIMLTASIISIVIMTLFAGYWFTIRFGS
ncbi:MAG: Mn2+/Fe2+ NRAMP family transporter [Myxococcota bacterium]|jgi:Mn2+/Fe2+ NRAMP family transporter